MLISERDKKELLGNIEQLRLQLYTLSSTKGVLDSEVIFVSQKLDHLLNRYETDRNPCVRFFTA